MGMMQIWELLSNMVTVIGLPMAIFIFFHEQRKRRETEEEEIYQLLSDGYTDFLKLVLDNPDLKLQSSHATPESERRPARTHARHVRHSDRPFRTRLRLCL